MSGLADAQPILTRRTAEVLRGAIPEPCAAGLDALVDEVLEPIFGWFLRGGAGRDVESDFQLAVARYHRPRLRITAFLLETLGPHRIGELLRSVASLSGEILRANEWKVGRAEAESLRQAFRSYEQVIGELIRLITAPPRAMRAPFDFLFRSARMDFCLSAAAGYLEGDIGGDVEQDRVVFLCGMAGKTTADVLDAVRSIRLAEDPDQLAAWRENRLDDLHGAWGNEPGMEQDLAQVYEARLDLRGQG